MPKAILIVQVLQGTQKLKFVLNTCGMHLFPDTVHSISMGYEIMDIEELTEYFQLSEHSQQQPGSHPSRLMLWQDGPSQRCW